MVYVGAVSILIIFALLMTRSGHELTLQEWRPMHWVWGTNHIWPSSLFGAFHHRF